MIYGLRRRTAGEVFAELQDGNQGQPPGREARVARAGIEVGEVGVVEDGAELVTELEVGVPSGEGGVRDACGVFGDGRERRSGRDTGGPREGGSDMV